MWQLLEVNQISKRQLYIDERIFDVTTATGDYFLSPLVAVCSPLNALRIAVSA